MIRILAVALFLSAPAFAADRPIPKPQTEAAELWFLVAAIALVVALVIVQILVNRR